ncbi:MAG: ankyrin repeat domain-containing protein [Candidatus Aegiribacteria sp.]|nr:ankyrin repeat domain-containing protein [Candidatus Aegiribacteria sp.]
MLTICKTRSVIARLLFVIVMLSINVGNAQDPFGEQTYPETIHTAEWLTRIEPATSWEAALDGEASDLLEFITSDLLLVGVVEVDRNSAPDFGPIYLIDTAAGYVKWKHDRDDLSGGSYTLLIVDPLIVLLGSDQSSARLVALDQESGRKVWDEKVDTPYGVASVPGQNQLILAFRDGSSFKVRILDLATGDKLIETCLPTDAFSGTTNISIDVADSLAYLVGNSVVILDLADGSVTGTVDIPLLASESASSVFLTDGILAWDTETIVYFDRTTDAVRWTVTAGAEPIRTVAICSEHIVRLSGIEQSMLSLLDPTTGQQVWSREIDGRIVSPITTIDDLLLCTTDSTVVGVRVADGGTAFVRPLPSDMAPGSPTFAEIMGLPDVLRAEEGVLFVSRERSGIAAFDLPSGNLRWYHEHHEANLALINYTADGRFASLYATMVEMGQISPDEPFMPPPSLSSANSSGTSQLLTTAQRRTETARARYEAGRGSASDVQMAVESEIVALQMDMAFGQLTAGLELAQSIMNLGIAFREIQRAQGRQGVIDRMELALQGALRAQENLFQSGYYVRPFYVQSWGRGVTIVQTANGLRRDIIFSPQSLPSLAYGLDMPTFAVNAEGDKLVVFGISLESDSYQRRNKWGTHVPNFSVLGYALNQLEFVSHATVHPYLEPAIAAGDVEQILWLTDQGLDINESTPQWGQTPIFHAVSVARPDIVELLISEGADVNAGDDSGGTPIFYAALMGLVDIVELFINAGADVNAVNAAGITPIEQIGLPQNAFDVLLAAGGRTASGDIPSQAEVAVPPLIMAIIVNQPDQVRILVENGEDLEWRNAHGETPLFFAVAFNNPELVRLFLELGAEVNAVDNQGRTPIDGALDEEIQTILRAAGGRSGLN